MAWWYSVLKDDSPYWTLQEPTRYSVIFNGTYVIYSQGGDVRACGDDEALVMMQEGGRSVY